MSRRVVWGLATTQVISWGILFYALPVVLADMQADTGWSRAAIAGGLTTAVTISGLLAPVVGRMLDTVRPRAVLTSASVAGGASVLLWSQASSLLVFYLAWACIGAVMAFVLYEAAFTILAKHHGEDARRHILTVSLAGGLASFVFQPIAGALTTTFGWRTAVAVLAAVFAGTTATVHWWALKPVAPRAGAMRSANASADGLAEWRQRRFWFLVAGLSATTLATFAASVHFITFLTDGGWRLEQAALASGAIGLVQLPGRLLFQPVAARFSARAVASTVLGLPALGIALLCVGVSAPGVWSAVVLLGLGQGAGVLLRPVLLVREYGPVRFGTVNGVAALPVTISRATGPLAVAYVVGRTASYGLAFAGLVGVAAAGIVIGRHGVRPGPAIDSERVD